MKNLMVWVHRKAGINGRHYKKCHDFENVLQILRAQIDNSLELGWRPEDIMVYTNFRFRHRGIRRIGRFPIYPSCSFVNKWTALQQLWNDGCEDDVWYHDCDAWQCVPFTFPDEVRHIGFVPYKFGMQGGSVFIRHAARGLIDEYVSCAMGRDVKNDEHLWNDFQRGQHHDAITLLNTTWNVGRTDWHQRIQAAEKPFRVVHLKSEESWIRHTLPDGKTVSANAFMCPERLQKILRQYGQWHPDNDVVT